METTAEEILTRVNNFTDEELLMNYAATLGIQTSPVVQFRLFQIRNPEYDDTFVQERLDALQECMQTERVQGHISQEEIREIYQAYLMDEEATESARLLTADVQWIPKGEDPQPDPSHHPANFLDEEMAESTRLLMEDGEWMPTGEDPQSGPSHHPANLLDEEMAETARLLIEDGEWMQMGEGEDPQPGTSHGQDAPQKLRYTMRKRAERTYARNSAVDTTYRIKVDEEHRGQKLQDVTEGLHDMFQDVLNQVRGNLAGNDLGRVVIHHEGLHDPVVVPLQPWDRLDAKAVLQTLEKVLNSNQELSINTSFEVTVGSIQLPKGGARRRITKIKGAMNSLDLKKSVVTIQNDDQLCMARAIGVSWAKQKKCTSEEWSEVTKRRGKKTNLQLILESKKVPDNYFKKLKDRNRSEQKQLAEALSQMAGVPLDRPASLSDIEAFENLLDVRVMVVCAKMKNKFITCPRNDDRPCIYVYLVDGDHFHSITSITGFFSAIYFCSKCLKHYNSREQHRCDETCIVCKTDHCSVTDQPRKCSDCNMNCRSQKCYDKHKEIPLHKKGKNKGKPRGPPECQKWYKCPVCYKVMNTNRRKKEDHQCGEYYCSSCKAYVMDDHLCYLRANDCKEDFIPKFIFFDFECSQDTISVCRDGYRPVKNLSCMECQPGKVCKPCSKCRHCKTGWCGQKNTHRPNFVIAHTICPKCIDQELTPDSVCKGCGTRCEECEKTDLHDNEDEGPCPGKCGFREVVFQGENTTEQFGQWLFSDQHEHFKVFAHNLKGYDGYFLLEYLIDNSLYPDKILYNGSKIMYMAVERGLNIKVLDSLNFLPMKLAALPEAFGLNELKKGWFPHYFNIKENQQYVGPYPQAEYYGAAFMSEQERGDLLAWLEQQKNETFDFRQEMLEYCRSDVTILRQACMKFRDLLMSATGKETEIVNKKGKKEKKWVGAVDPFDSVTIASVCMNVYRTKFLEEAWRVQLNDVDEWIPAKRSNNTLSVLQNGDWVSEGVLNITKSEFVSTPIAKLPPNGYRDQYSKVSIQWLEWRAHKDKVDIQHALNGGEKSIAGTRYKLDGYCQETNTVYEYHGCVFHGCHVCFSENRKEVLHPLTKQSMDELYALTQKKKAYLEKLGMRYVCIWDHEFKQQCDRDQELRQFIQQLDVSDRLDPRESFFGGRTNASKLYYKVEESETKVKYSDFCSLYPYVNKYCRYPVGHPTIITGGFKDMKDYFGIAKVKILPPRGLYHPVLPYKSNGKLTFPLCKTCADTENPDPCSCTEEERALTGTWCTPEIQTALRLGYTLLKIYEIYHWEHTTQYDSTSGEGGLFAQYINTFLKFKQEASGPPDWVKSEHDMTV